MQYLAMSLAQAGFVCMSAACSGVLSISNSLASGLSTFISASVGFIPSFFMKKLTKTSLFCSQAAMERLVFVESIVSVDGYGKRINFPNSVFLFVAEIAFANSLMSSESFIEPDRFPGGLDKLSRRSLNAEAGSMFDFQVT